MDEAHGDAGFHEFSEHLEKRHRPPATGDVHVLDVRGHDPQEPPRLRHQVDNHPGMDFLVEQQFPHGGG
jgi:hypothetical protein